MVQAAGSTEIRGSVVNGTGGAGVPVDAAVELFVFDGHDLITTFESFTTADGEYLFEGIPHVETYIYYVQVEYAGVPYYSAAISGSDLPLDDVRITVYETTDSTGLLLVNRLHVAFDRFAEDELYAGQVWVFFNAGDRTILPENGLQIPIPAGAIDVLVENDPMGQFHHIENDNLFLLLPFRPGAGAGSVEISFRFGAVPALDFRQQLPLPVEVAVVMTPVGVLSLSGADLEPAEVFDMQGTQIESYLAGPFTAGDMLVVTVGSGSETVDWKADPNSWLGLVFGLFAIFAAGYLSVRKLRRPGLVGRVDHVSAPTDNTIVDSILQLDQDFQRGKLARADYLVQRTALKAKLGSRQD